MVPIYKNETQTRSLGSSINVKSVNDSEKFQNHCPRAILLVLAVFAIN